MEEGSSKIRVKSHRHFELPSIVTFSSTSTYDVTCCCVITPTADGKARGIYSTLNGKLGLVNLETGVEEASFFEPQNHIYWLQVFKNDGKDVTPNLIVVSRTRGKIEIRGGLSLELKHKVDLEGGCLWRCATFDDGDENTIRVLSCGWQKGKRHFVEFSTNSTKTEFETKRIVNIPMSTLEGKPRVSCYIFDTVVLKKKPDHIAFVIHSFPSSFIELFSWKEEKVVQRFDCVSSTSIISFIQPTTNEERLLCVGGEKDKVRVYSLEGKLMKVFTSQESFLVPHSVQERPEFRCIMPVNDSLFIIGTRSLSFFSFQMSREDDDDSTSCKFSCLFSESSKLQEKGNYSSFNTRTVYFMHWFDDEKSPYFLACLSANVMSAGLLRSYELVNGSELRGKGNREIELSKKDLEERTLFLFELENHENFEIRTMGNEMSIPKIFLL